jgi:cell fate (sporulation/competence/biofilm development) regulator YlbF (YheA/YmcA/DUF963 family)
MKPMEKELLNDLTSLKEALHADPRVQKLDDLEKKIAADPQVKELSKALDDYEKQYEDLLVYKKETDPEAIAAQKTLYAAKEKMDAYPLVKEYNEAYTVVRDLYMQIDDILFSPFRKKSLTWEAK